METKLGNIHCQRCNTVSPYELKDILTGESNIGFFKHHGLLFGNFDPGDGMVLFYLSLFVF